MGSNFGDNILMNPPGKSAIIKMKDTAMRVTPSVRLTDIRCKGFEIYDFHRFPITADACRGSETHSHHFLFGAAMRGQSHHKRIMSANTTMRCNQVITTS